MVPSALKILLLPPSCLFLAALVGWLLRRRRPRLAKFLIGTSGALLYALCTPLCGAFLLRTLQRSPPWSSDVGATAQAIAVLAGDLNGFAPDYGGVTVGGLTLERLRMAAKVQRETGLPILTSGGALRRSREPMADLMARILAEELGAETRWRERESGNTFANAELSSRLLKAEGVDRVILVTHVWHMPRAEACFRATGLEVIPAPTGFRIAPQAELSEILPSARGLSDSARALHEWLGLVAYRVFYL